MRVSQIPLSGNQTPFPKDKRYTTFGFPTPQNHFSRGLPLPKSIQERGSVCELGRLVLLANMKRRNTFFSRALGFLLAIEERLP
jgi:hypothetical protein